MTKKYHVMAIKVEEADSSIEMEDNYIPVSVIYHSDGPYLSVLIPAEEPKKLTDETKLESASVKDETHGQ